MKIKFEQRLDYQLDAINSVVDLFKSQKFRQQDVFLVPENGIMKNYLDLKQEQILTNLQEVQKQNNIKKSEKLEGMNFTVEMETGTGKTYVYLRTIFELSKNYGFKKFIIIVPSIAIKEGVLKTLQITSKHFKEIYDRILYKFTEYESRRLSYINQFSRSNKIEILVMTIDSFNKDTNIMNTYLDKLSGQKPIDLVSRTQPILILDEPQNMESDNAKRAISNLNPLFILRYSATHRNYYNLVYRLTPVDAYNRNLVKKIEVSSVVKEDDFNGPYIKCLEIKADSKTVKAKLKVNKKLKSGLKLAEIIVNSAQNLAEKTGLMEYEGFVVSEINAKYNFVKFVNATSVGLGEEIGGDRDKILRIQIEQTIEEHFRKHRILKQQEIKVLSLFFIDRVDNYVTEDGIIKKNFEEAFNRLKQKFDEFKDVDVKTVHAGYFSKMKNIKKMEEDRDTFSLIMKDKERLLSFDESVQFIFSHSALREGWDNPNIFNICTLNQTFSNIKKRQEIGRGMRLPVNQSGERVHLEDHNNLTVIANESYKDYVSKLQQEYVDEYGLEVKPPKPFNGKNRYTLKLNTEQLRNSDFNELWNRLSKRTKYMVNIDSERLIDQCVNKINKRISINEIKIKIEKISLQFEDQEEEIRTTPKPVGHGYEPYSRNIPIPNIVEYLANETHLTYRTLLKILSNLNNLHLVFVNPQEYILSVALIIKETISDFLVNGIVYRDINDRFILECFKDIDTYKDEIVPVNKSIYEGVICDSQIERKFAMNLNDEEKVKFLIKLPNWYIVNTPIGEYNPDWAIVFQDTTQFREAKSKLYLVTETKGTTQQGNLRPSEQRKIECAKEHFETLNVEYILADKFEQILDHY